MVQRNLNAELVNENYDGTSMPNFMIWGWMTTLLGLKDKALMLFAYIYSQSHDSIHYSATSPTNISKWFGITRKTLYNRLADLPFIEQLTSNNHIKGAYKFVYYRINMEALLKSITKSDNNDYINFMKSYEHMLVLHFPDDKEDISNYIQTMIDWHGGMGEDIINAFKAIVKLGDVLRTGEKEYKNTKFVEALNVVINEVKKDKLLLDRITECCQDAVDSEEPVKTNVFVDDNTNNVNTTTNTEESEIIVPTDDNTDSSGTADIVDNKPTETEQPKKRKHERNTNLPSIDEINQMKEKKKRGRPALLNNTKTVAKENMLAQIDRLKTAGINYVAENFNSDMELNNAIESYINKFGTHKMTVNDLTFILNNLSAKYPDAEDIAYCINYATSVSAKDVLSKKVQNNVEPFINNKRIDKINAVIVDNAKVVIDEFVKNEADNNTELANILKIFYEERIAKDMINNHKELSENQIHNLLKNLKECCNTVDDMIKSVNLSNDRAYKSFYAVNNNNSNNSYNNSNNNQPQDIEEKKKLIDKFVADNWYYLYPDIKEGLIDYVENTSNGQGCTAKQFAANLNQLGLYKFEYDMCKEAINNAIARNYPNLCIEDKNMTNMLNMQCYSYESRQHTAISYRRRECEQTYKKNPTDERLVNMPVPQSPTKPVYI